MSHPVELERGFAMPINFYPIFESAFRASRGESISDHRDRVSELWETFNRVACANPYSWVRNPMTAEEIRNPGPANRLVGFPHKSHELELGSRPGRSFDRVFRGNGRSGGRGEIVGWLPHAGTTAPTQILCRTEPIFTPHQPSGSLAKGQWN